VKQDRKELWRSNSLMPALILIMTLSSLAALWVAPAVHAKYAAAGKGSATAQIAAFDIGEVKHAGFGQNEMLYYHKAFAEEISGYYIEAKNTSEVTVRAKLRFFNVLRDNGVIAAGYNWWSTPGHRRMLFDNINIFNGNAPATARANTQDGNGNASLHINTAYPCIHNVRTANAGGAVYAATAPQYYNAAAGENEGALVQPGETIRFYFDISHELLWGYTMSDGRNVDIQDMDDFSGRGPLDAVFSINFDIIATQID
jgi:hypothetical protein